MIMNDFAYKARNGSRRFLTHRVPVPFPLFILKIGLIVGLVALSAVFVIRTVLLTKKLEWQPPPMVLVPGVMGSKLYVEAFDVVYPPGDKKYANCSANIPLRKSWVSDQLADQTQCELFLLSLDFQRDGKFHNQRNVKMGANLEGVPFGSSLWPIQCTYTDKQPRLCDYSTFKGMDDSYFRRLGLFLSSQLKYQVGSTLFAAQYDWRHDQQSDEMNTYYEDLRSLVERAVNSTKRKAVLLGHSMGNIVINRFLRNKVSPEWQKTYLQSTINVAAPFGGAVGMLRGLIYGKTMELPNNGTIPGRDVAELLRQMGFPANLLPFNNAFGEQNVLKIGDIQIKGHQMLDFLLLIKGGRFNPFYEQNEPQPQAHVPMHCVYSVSPNNTDSYLEYKSMDDPEPKTTLGDGDGSVNAESLRVCEQWKAQGHPVTIKEFGKFEHSQILMEKDFFAYIADLLISF